MSEPVPVDPRVLKISILRHNPQDPASRPRMECYEVEEGPGMTLFIALNDIRDRLAPSLQFDFVCRAGICGSCGMLINGRPGLACRTLTATLDTEITLAPLPVFRLIADLSVDTGAWMKRMSERLRTWVHEQSEIDPVHRMRLLHRRLRHGTHAQRFHRCGGNQQDGAFSARSTRPAQRCRLL